jgi:uncharacterized protein (TIGR03083 family)
VDLLVEIADERRGVADLIDALTPAQLASPSLCEGWTVQDVAGHLLMPLITPLPRVAFSLVRHRLDFDRANDVLSRAVARRPAAELAAALRDRASTAFKPPGLGFEAPLNDLLVHQQDIRRPLGLRAELVPARVRVCLDFHAARIRDGSALAGIRLQATDLDWVHDPDSPAHDDGELVLRGPAEALLLVVNRRYVVLGELTGSGLDLVKARISG